MKLKERAGTWKYMLCYPIAVRDRLAVRVRAANSGIFHDEVRILIAIRRDDDMPRVLRYMKLAISKDLVRSYQASI